MPYLLFIFALFGLNQWLSPQPPPSTNHQAESQYFMAVDSTPVRVTEDLIRELTQRSAEKTWRDSGYYFTLALVDWEVNRIRTGQNGTTKMLTTISSADPSGVQFTGTAVFRFATEDLNAPGPLTTELYGQALVSLPQDLLMCPSTEMELGLGQVESRLPLNTYGEIIELGSIWDTLPPQVKAPTAVNMLWFEIQ